jgi:transcriptional regulator with XRE-family HTH domain
MNNLKTLIRDYQSRNKKPDGSLLTQHEIAEMADVDPATLSRYANNQIGSINLEIWQKLVNFFGVEGYEIFNMRPDAEKDLSGVR